MTANEIIPVPFIIYPLYIYIHSNVNSPKKKNNARKPLAKKARGFEYVRRAPIIDDVITCAAYAHGSAQVSPRHIESTTYCCFLPDLTGFMGSYCAGPEASTPLP